MGEVIWLVIPVFDDNYKSGCGMPVATFLTERDAQDFIDGYEYEGAELIAVGMTLGFVDNRKAWAKWMCARRRRASDADLEVASDAPPAAASDARLEVGVHRVAGGADADSEQFGDGIASLNRRLREAVGIDPDGAASGDRRVGVKGDGRAAFLDTAERCEDEHELRSGSEVKHDA